MESILAEPVKNEIQSLVTLVKKESSYLCCFNRYAQDFEDKKAILEAKLEDESRKIDKARGASHVTSAALQWKNAAEKLIATNTEKEKCLNDLCLNCWSQYWKARDLGKRTLDIDKHLERCNFDTVDGPTALPGIKYYCIQHFMHFGSRNSTFQDLKKALEDYEHNMVGLHGLGGTGKTSMATQVGAELDGSTFGKVIFLVVSKPPNFKKIRREISKQLELEIKDQEEEGLQDKILNKIIALEAKLLIILDDVWEKFDIKKELGIPPHNQQKGCTVLITTRNEDICKKMDCQSTIPLYTLTVEEAMSLFQEHTGSIPILESSAHKIVEHCHGVPVVIVAVARSLKGRPSKVWMEALTTLEKSGSILNVKDDPDLKGIYEGLKLSYDHLEKESAKKLFLISSLFPEDSNIPMEILIRIGVGMGPFRVVDDYNERRRKVLDAVMELLDSSLLLNAEEECVKMHDLVHEVALLIGKDSIQASTESEQLVKEGLQCLLWENDYFPKHIDGRNLECLIIDLVDKNNQKNLEAPGTFFTEMTKLKVLLLFYRADHYLSSAIPILPSIQTLYDLRTLMLVNFELCSISVLGKLPNLETLWLHDCLIIKSPEVSELGKLRFLRIAECEIKMSNPLKFLEQCPKLEELTFLGNRYDKRIAEKVYFHVLQIYQIFSVQHLSDRYFEEYGSQLSRCFCPGELIHLMSEATFKQLASTSQLLILEGYEETKHKNFVPHIIALEQTKNLIILELHSWHGMQCLIDDVNIRFDVNAFSNLVELKLRDIGLSKMLFNGNYELCRLKIMSLESCDKLKSIFLPSTAQTLSRLEQLEIDGCDALECIIEDKSLRGENDQKSYNTLFPELKVLLVSRCGNLEIILPILPGVHLETIIIGECQNLKYIFDKFQEINDKNFFRERMNLVDLPSLLGIFKEHEKSMSASMQRPATTRTKASSFSWTQVFCFKSRTTIEETNDAVSTRALPDEGTPQILDMEGIDLANWTTPEELYETTDGVPPFHTIQSLLVHSLKNVREIRLINCWNLTSLSTQSIAASAISLEKLHISRCDKLKCISTHEREDARVDQNYCSIFPMLKRLEIYHCDELEFLFASEMSVVFENLKSLYIQETPKLTYVVGNYTEDQHSSNQNQHDEIQFKLPVLETLEIGDAPMMNGICSKNYKLVMSSSLRNVYIWWSNIKCLQQESTNRAPLSQSTLNLLIESFKNIREMKLAYCAHLVSVFALSIASTVLWEDLTIEGCHQLKCIVSDEGDIGTNMNYDSIFPKLKLLEVSECNTLEYLFPAYAFRSPIYLESLKIRDAPMLNYVFERSQHDNLTFGNQNVQTHIDFPALKDLSIRCVPQLVSIYPEKYYLRGSSLSSVVLEGFPKFPMRLFNGFLVCWHTEQQETKVFEISHQSLECLEIENSKIEECLFVTDLEAEKSGNRLEPLASSFSGLRKLYIRECRKLKAIFSTSIVRSLPKLEELSISDCEELVQIFEEDIETSGRHNHLCQEPCFPNLKCVSVTDCHKLKYLFSITTNDMFPKLRELRISEAYDLEHVLIRRGDMKQMIMKDDVLPELQSLELIELPNLVSVCHGINIQISFDGLRVYVDGCPKFSKTSTAQLQRADSQAKEKAEEKSSLHMSSDQSINTEGATQQSIPKMPIHISPNRPIFPPSDNFFDEEKEEEVSPNNEQTSKGMMPQSPMSSKASTSLNQTPSFVPTKPSHETTATTPEQITSQLNGRQATETHHPTTIDFSSNFTRDELVVDQERNDETPMFEPKLQEEMAAGHDKQSYDQKEEPKEGALVASDRPQSVLKPDISLNGRQAAETQHPTIIGSSSNFTIDELVDQVKEETPTFEPKLQEQMAAGHDKQSHDQKEVQKEDCTKDEAYEVREGAEQMLSSKAVETQQSPTISSNFTRDPMEEGIVAEKLKMTSLSWGSNITGQSDELVDQEVKEEAPTLKLKLQEAMAGHDKQSHEHKDEKKEGGPNVLCTTSHDQTLESTPRKSTDDDIPQPINVIEHESKENSSNLRQVELEPSCSKGQVEHHTTKSSVNNHQALNVGDGLKEIVEMMKLEGSEICLLEEALNTHPQLCLSTNDRSTQMMCISYRILIDILNILTTKTLFTISEADKKLLEDKLKDASLLGFDKDWIEAVKTKVFNCDASEVDGVQEILKDLENELKANEAMLAATRNQEVKAAQVVELAQKELDCALQDHASVMADHSQLLKARQGIIAKQNQCWDLIAAKNKPFGF